MTRITVIFVLPALVSGVLHPNLGVPIASQQAIRSGYTRKGKGLKRTIKHLPFPVTEAYAFTDYRSQGQTIQYHSSMSLMSLLTWHGYSQSLKNLGGVVS